MITLERSAVVSREARQRIPFGIKQLHLQVALVFPRLGRLLRRARDEIDAELLAAERLRLRDRRADGRAAGG